MIFARNLTCEKKKKYDCFVKLANRQATAYDKQSAENAIVSIDTQIMWLH